MREELKRHIARENARQPLRDRIADAPAWQERLAAIRALYESIERDGEQPEHIDPYSLGIDAFWTPIEWMLWQDIRSAGIVMLPQYPVGPYFVDFGDPVKRIAIEADGKAFHDRGRDERRDRDLCERFGWRVFRVTGAECFRIRPEPWEFHYPDGEPGPEARHAAPDFYLTTSTGVVSAIHRRYYREPDGQGHFDELIAETLARHTLVPLEDA